MTRTDRVLESAFILHARNYRDTSVMMDVFTRQTGRYTVVVRGARSRRSGLRGQLQPFCPLLMASVGRGELRTATSIERVPVSCRLTGNGLLLGLYVNELLYRLLGRYDPMPELFDRYEALLLQLQETGEAIAALRGFELGLLQELGYGINFSYDARNGEEIEPTAAYRYRLHEGFHRTVDTGEELFTGQELLSIAAGDLELVDDNRLRYLTRRSLAPLLGEKPLKSRSLFRGTAFRGKGNAR